MRGSGAVSVRKILAPVDGTPASRTAVHLAAQMAVAFGAELTILHVVGVTELPVLMGELESPAEVERGEVVLAEAARLARRDGVEPRVRLRRGRAADQILRHAAEAGSDLIVMGTREYRGTRAVLMGSVSRAVSHRARASVVLVRATRPPRR
jgi:nucleotide-binding universal stress UspA family protein